MSYIAFPGCFNPPTYTHFAIAAYVSQYFNGAKIIFIPVSDKYSKWNLIDSKHRLAMLKLIKNKNFLVSDIETKYDTQPKTIQTLAKLNQKNIRLLIGSDNLLNLKSWYKYEELIIKYKPIIVERGADNAQKIINTLYPKYKQSFEIIKGIIHSDDSSTFIRDNVIKGFNCDFYLPDKIIKYIKKHHLYEKNN
jgi:nicotinate-nucleotide adenylyltransferase